MLSPNLLGLIQILLNVDDQGKSPLLQEAALDSGTFVAFSEHHSSNTFHLLNLLSCKIFGVYLKTTVGTLYVLGDGYANEC